MKQIFKIPKKLSGLLYVQGGGGNFSFKKHNKIYIKSSGVTFKEIKPGKGYVCLNLNPVQKYFLAIKSYSPKVEQNFDRLVIKNLILNESFGRPSIESSLHIAIKSKVVIHTHHVLANVFTCMENGKIYLSKIFGNSGFVWIPYQNPGLDLALGIKQNYKKTLPIFIQNHGLVIHDSSINKTLKHTLKITKKLTTYLKIQKAYVPVKYLAKTADFSKHLFPDSAVYGKEKFSNLNSKQKTVFFETASVTNYILKTIAKLKEKPTFLSSPAVNFLDKMEKEKFRINLLKNSK